MLLCIILVSAAFYIGLRLAFVTVPEDIKELKQIFKNAPEVSENE